MNLGQWFNKGASVAGLGQTVVARQVSGGAAPGGCYGLQLTPDGLSLGVAPGERPRLGAADKLFWVHPGPYELSFAPDGNQPEAGVLLQLQATVSHHALDDRLGAFLATLNQPELTVGDLQAWLRRSLLVGPHFLPTAAEPEELQALRADFSNRLQKECGLACLRLEAVDLGQQVDTASLMRAAQATASADADATPAVEPASAASPASSSVPAAEPDVGPDRPAAEIWPADAQALDARLRQRLFLDLPHLVVRLRQWVPPDRDQFARHRQLVHRIEHVGYAAANLPPLHKAGAQQATARLQRLRYAHMRQAVAALTDASVLADALAAGQAGVQADGPAHLLSELDRAVATLQAEVAQRALNAEAA